jgi:hypothetical protein
LIAGLVDVAGVAPSAAREYEKMQGASPIRSWYSFSLRSLFIAIAIIAVWLGYYANWQRQRREARAYMNHCPSQEFESYRIFPSVPLELPWALQAMGETPELFLWIDDDDIDPNRVKKLFPESAILVYD